MTAALAAALLLLALREVSHLLQLRELNRVAQDLRAADAATAAQQHESLVSATEGAHDVVRLLVRQLELGATQAMQERHALLERIQRPHHEPVPAHLDEPDLPKLHISEDDEIAAARAAAAAAIEAELEARVGLDL